MRHTHFKNDALYLVSNVGQVKCILLLLVNNVQQVKCLLQSYKWLKQCDLILAMHFIIRAMPIDDIDYTLGINLYFIKIGISFSLQ